MRLKGIFLYIDSGFGIELQKFFQTASVVVMTMGNDHSIYFFQIDSQFPGIFQKGTVRSQIKEQPVIRGLYVKRKPVGGLTLTHGLIFYQHNCFHSIFPVVLLLLGNVSLSFQSLCTQYSAACCSADCIVG